LIDEIRILAENEPEGDGMSVSAKKEERAAPTSTSPPCFLITTIGGRYLAFEAQLIQGVLANEGVEFLQSPVVQGVLYRAMNLAGRLQLPAERLRERIDVVLLAHEQSRCSVQVQKVHGILEIQRSQVLPLPAQFRGPERRWYRGLILFNCSVALVLNTSWVIEEQIEGGGASVEPLAGESIVALQGAIQSKSPTC